MRRSAGRGVVHFIERWLPLSESFVHGLVTRTRRPGVVVSSRATENTDVYPYRPLHSLEWAARLPAGVRRRAVTLALGAIARRHHADVIHVHHGYRAYEVIGAADRFRMPMVVSLHGHDATGHAWTRPEVYARVLARADAVVVPSRFLVAHAVAAGAAEAAIHVIPSGVDTTWFTPSPLPLRPEALFVGRFVDKKGLDVLLTAWPDVLRVVPEARLRLLGYGPLEQLARSGGPSVEVVLSPDREGVRGAIRRARVVVSPSRTASDDAVESLLIVNLEAQASGRPVVTTRHGGIPEFVDDGRTALVVPEADPAALANALVRMLTDDELATSLALAGPSWAAQFDVAVCTSRVDDLYDALRSGSSVPGDGR
jgi:glycosyltransferase involved in cell wall biosynthesis